jgi:hypothetical protein
MKDIRILNQILNEIIPCFSNKLQTAVDDLSEDIRKNRNIKWKKKFKSKAFMFSFSL